MTTASFRSNLKRRASYHLWEYSLGDKMYHGLPELLTEFKMSNGSPALPSSDYIDGLLAVFGLVRGSAELSELMLQWNKMLQFYRGRNEHLVSEIKQGRCLDHRWRNSY
eukprot:2446325-Prymnesium_polylepis.1